MSIDWIVDIIVTYCILKFKYTLVPTMKTLDCIGNSMLIFILVVATVVALLITCQQGFTAIRNFPAVPAGANILDADRILTPH